VWKEEIREIDREKKRREEEEKKREKNTEKGKKTGKIWRKVEAGDEKQRRRVKEDSFS
jgi:hypothetical protein